MKRVASLSSSLCNNDDESSEIPLPDELISKIIFKYVPVRLWSMFVVRISKQFQRCVSVAYRKVRLLDIQNLFPLKLKKELLKRKTDRQPEWSSNLLSKILDNLLLLCPFLMELNGFDAITDTLTDTHCNILMKFKHLRSVSFENLAMSAKDLVGLATNCKTLTILHVFDCEFFGDKLGDLLVVNASTNLTNVTLTHCRGVLFSCDIFHFGLCSETLTTLNLSFVGKLFHNDKDDEQIAKRCPNLESLTAELANSRDTQIVLEALPNLHKLTSLNLSIHSQPFFCAKDLCSSLSSLANRLESLELDYYVPDGSEQVQKLIFTKLLNLRRLKISPFNIPISGNELALLSASLENLCLGSHQTVGINALPYLLPLRNLTDLNLRKFSASCETWEDVCLFEKLRHLRLPNMAMSMSNSGNHFLKIWDSKGNGMLERLVTLEMPFTWHLTDVGGCLLAEKAKNLEILELNCCQITDKTISTLADVAKKLKKLTFNHEPLHDEQYLFNTKTVAQLVKKCVYLKTIKVGENLAEELAENEHFLPFADDVEILIYTL